LRGDGFFLAEIVKLGYLIGSLKLTAIWESFMEHRPARLSNLIEQVLGSLGLSEKFHGWRIVGLWPELVGPEIARQARAVRYAEGVLTVIVEKDVWRQELEMQMDTILDRVRTAPGGRSIKKIVFRAGSHTENQNDQGSCGR